MNYIFDDFEELENSSEIFPIMSIQEESSIQ